MPTRKGRKAGAAKSVKKITAQRVGRTPKRARDDRRTPPVGLIPVLDRLLRRRITISVRGRQKQVFVVEAIFLQLVKKSLAGDKRASRALVKLFLYANVRVAEPPKLVFVENPYTWSFADTAPEGGHG